MKFSEIVKSFPTTPFLFIGSGFSRRYYGLPDWRGLLQFFVNRLSDDEFAFNKYLNDAKNIPPEDADGGLLAVAAGLIMKDFDDRWFKDRSFRRVDEEYKKFVHDGHSPFKVEIAQYIKKHSYIVPKMIEEVNLLKSISVRSLSGVITTNYDQLLEYITEYKSFIGQDELIFSQLQGFGEIYKIHGCVTRPQDIVITNDDYRGFREKCSYLAAKLMTTFMEYPIIFMGYSITDTNIRWILNELGKCLTPNNLEKLQNRFIYIQYTEGIKELNIFKHSVNIGDSVINMTGVGIDNFIKIYSALSRKKAALPAKMFRIFKESFYEYTISGIPNEHIRIGNIDNENINDKDLVIGIGRSSDFSLTGLYGVSREQWFYNIILHNLPYTSDQLLSAYKKIKGSDKLPVNMLLSISIDKSEYLMNERYTSIDDIVSKTIQNHRKTRNIPIRSISGILSSRDQNDIDERKKTLFDMIHLTEEEVNIDDLEFFLKRTLDDKGFLTSITGIYKTSLFQLISIYDYMKYAKKVDTD